MPIHKDAEDVRCYLEVKCIAEKVLHASAVDERDDLDGWHVVRDTEQIKQRWVKLSDWLVLLVSIRRFFGSLGHCLHMRKIHQIHDKELSKHWNQLSLRLKNIKHKGMEQFQANDAVGRKCIRK